MKKILKLTLIAAVIPLFATACIEQVFPQTSTVTGDQVASAPGSFDTAVGTITGTMVGQFTYAGTSYQPWDFGYPSFFLQRDVQGQDMLSSTGASAWYSRWYEIRSMAANTNTVQLAWTYYYKWIGNCNIVLSLAGSEPTDAQRSGIGIAYAMRAMYYMDLARMYFDKNDPDLGTVPIVTESTSLEQLTNNPRVPWDDMWAFIIDDLNKAEGYLTGFDRKGDIRLPDVSVVYGLKARAYLTMASKDNNSDHWTQAKDYAKRAQAGYSVTTNAQYTDRMTAFNTPTESWMLGVTFRDSDPNITANDSDSNWGSQMFLEVGVAGLYANAYGQPFRIDRHLYETIPATDIRKHCYLGFDLDDMPEEERFATIRERQSDYPEALQATANATTSGELAGLILKFRAAGGTAGRQNPYLATVCSVPLMRVDEMMLIEAEAAGRLNEGDGIALLTAFATIRDPQYDYATANGTNFLDKLWWQRRVELFGEGFTTFDIKRLGKGIVRSYPGTNHPEGYRYNTTDVPQWMNTCIVTSEAQYNFAIENNPNPETPAGDSPEHIW